MENKNGRTWAIARHHFLSEIRKRSFIFVLFSLPLLIVVSVGLGILSQELTEQTTTLGYVDPAGFLVHPDLDDEDVELRQFQTVEAAQSALESQQINAYYLLSEDFATTTTAEIIFYEPPGAQAQTAFVDMVRRNHLNDLSPDIAQRILDGSSIRVQPLNSERTFGSSPEVADFLPLLIAFIFIFMTVTTSGYMLSTLVTEKENRTMEIVISSISAGKLVTGKIIGAIGIAIVQFLVYALCILIGLIVGQASGLALLQDIQPRWQDILQVIIVAIPVYLFLAALFTTIGATLVESTEAQQIGPFAFLLLLLPIYVLPGIIEDPNGPLSLFLSFFPPTAILTFALRLILSAVSWSHVLISAAISLLSALAMTRLAAKAFRINMLSYGQRLNLRDLLRLAATR